MAIGDKKSLLQPSSTQSQQFRLQFTNLQPTSLTAQQPSPVSNARPVVSTFVSAPAPVSLQAPPTIPPKPPTPIPAATPVVSNPPIVFSDTAFYFDGNSLFSSSLESVDLPILFTGSFGIMLAIKPSTFTPATEQTLFHMYTGSFASQSIKISLTPAGNIKTTFSDSGNTLESSVSSKGATLGTLGNGYTLVTYEHGIGYPPNVNIPANLQPSTYIGNRRSITSESMRDQNGQLLFSNTFTQADHLTIGGTQHTTGSNFVGNIAFVAIKVNVPFFSNERAQVLSGAVKPKQITSFGSGGVVGGGVKRIYTFGEPKSNTFVIETTGSIATKQVPLQRSGSDYDFPNAMGSYFTV